MGLAATAKAITANSDKRRIPLWGSDAMGGEVVIGFAAAPNAVARNILLSVGASFVAAGFVSWAILQAKELTMAIADWIREATERRRRRIIAEAVQSDEYRKGYAEGFHEGLVEGYDMGCDDADKGKPRRWPPTNGVNRGGSSDNGASK